MTNLSFTIALEAWNRAEENDQAATVAAFAEVSLNLGQWQEFGPSPLASLEMNYPWTPGVVLETEVALGRDFGSPFTAAYLRLRYELVPPPQFKVLATVSTVVRVNPTLPL